MSRPKNHNGDGTSGSLAQANIRIGGEAHTKDLTQVNTRKAKLGNPVAELIDGEGHVRAE
jgi:hypothetical protein